MFNKKWTEGEVKSPALVKAVVEVGRWLNKGVRFNQGPVVVAIGVVHPFILSHSDRGQEEGVKYLALVKAVVAMGVGIKTFVFSN